MATFNSDRRGENEILISARRGWFDLDIAGVWRYRDLVVLLFKRDFIALYKQTILGPLWYVIQPALTTIAFTLVFNKIAGISTEGTPPFLFYMAGIVIWNFFANCLSKTSDTFVSNAAIFGKVYFPRLVVPASVALSNVLTFVIQFLLLLSLFLYYWLAGANLALRPQAVLIVLLLPYIAALGLSVGIAVSALTTRYRDLTFLIGFAIQLWMYATPVVYPLSQIPEKWRWVYAFNPMAAPLETFRSLVFGTGSVEPRLWLGSAAISCVLVSVGLMLFSHAERTSMDTV